MPHRLNQFLRIATRDFLHVGSILPSSPCVIKAITKALPEDCQNIIEFGPGDGTITKALLEQLPANGKLYAVEINREFVDELRKIKDPRLFVIADDVQHVAKQLPQLFPQGVDAVVSGIPFSFIPAETRSTIVADTRRALRPKGRFVVYQNSTLMRNTLEAHFSKVKVGFEPRNIFPYFIMSAEA